VYWTILISICLNIYKEESMPFISWEDLIARVEADRPVGDPYILFRNGVPVAAALVPSMNPGLPEEILIGDDPDVIRKAERLLNCLHPIPLFIKHDTNQWEYNGMYGQPQRIADQAIYNNNLEIRLVLHPREYVKFAIHWEKVGE
jgi:hypothetical protein